jgi:hypothetical protein
MNARSAVPRPLDFGGCPSCDPKAARSRCRHAQGQGRSDRLLDPRRRHGSLDPADTGRSAARRIVRRRHHRGCLLERADVRALRRARAFSGFRLRTGPGARRHPCRWLVVLCDGPALDCLPWSCRYRLVRWASSCHRSPARGGSSRQPANRHDDSDRSEPLAVRRPHRSPDCGVGTAGYVAEPMRLRPTTPCLQTMRPRGLSPPLPAPRCDSNGLRAPPPDYTCGPIVARSMTATPRRRWGGRRRSDSPASPGGGRLQGCRAGRCRPGWAHRPRGRG